MNINANQYDKCIKEGGFYRDCMRYERDRQDKLLNINYKKAMNRLKGERREQLREIQRLWIKYTNAKCSFYYHKHSGSGGLDEAIFCEMQEATKRALELSEIY